MDVVILAVFSIALIVFLVLRLSDYGHQVDRLLRAIRKHRDQKGDDRCWLDDEELYAELPEGYKRTDLALHEPEEMLPNCERFLKSRQPGGCPYVSPQREIERLQAEVTRLRAALAERAP